MEVSSSTERVGAVAVAVGASLAAEIVKLIVFARASVNPSVMM